MKNRQSTLIGFELDRLMRLVTENISSNRALAESAFDTAWNLAVHSNQKVPKGLRMLKCKRCGYITYPGVSVEVRLKSGLCVWKCSRCGYLKRFRYK